MAVEEIFGNKKVISYHQALNGTLKDKLQEIAIQNADGLVPIHGRLFAQWLHFVFPHDCPYPHTGGLSPKTQEQWRAQVGEEEESVSEEEVLLHLQADYGQRE